jgi:ATP-dependent DNA ligase
MTRTANTDDQGQRVPARARQPDWVEPELATLTADRFSDPAWIFERKFDGERCLAFRAGQQLRLVTRNQQQVTSTYPEIAGALRAQEACIKGWEGIIAKRADSPYRPGRTRDWLKFKCQNAQEFVIGGYTDPRGSRTGFGALLLGYYDTDGKLRYAGKVGIGFDRRTLTSLHAALAADERPEPPFEPVRGLPRSGVHWVEPWLVAQVGFTEWTADGQLRHPRFQGLRRDKDPADVVREMP